MVLNFLSGVNICIDYKGYPHFTIRDKSRQYKSLVHVFIWELINGKKPKGYDIHHKDLDKGNYALENLELLSHLDHRRVHAGWVKDELGEWAAKRCPGCFKLLKLTEYGQHLSGPKAGQPYSRCNPCLRIKNKRQYTSAKGVPHGKCKSELKKRTVLYRDQGIRMLESTD